MNEVNQGLPGPERRGDDVSPGDEALAASPAVHLETQEPAAPAVDGDPSAPQDLSLWLLAVAALGIGALVLGQAELTVLVVLAGVFAVAHAADLRPERVGAYHAIAWVIPAGAVFGFVVLGYALSLPGIQPSDRRLGMAVTAVGLVVSLVAALRPVAHQIARRLFRRPYSSHVMRLGARLALIGLLSCVPSNLAFPLAMDQIEAGSLVGAGSLWANLIGMTVLALGAVGYRVRRNGAATLHRLGIEPLKPAHLGIVALGLIGLLAANAGAELLERAWFPDLWARDQRVTEAIAGDLTRGEALLLGFSAGIGEELVLRGALQPMMGIVPTALLFALLHVQYSWFGMAIIATLGLLLGWIRARTSTSVAIGVHVLYDIAAVMTLGG